SCLRSSQAYCWGKVQDPERSTTELALSMLLRRTRWRTEFRKSCEQLQWDRSRLFVRSEQSREQKQPSGRSAKGKSLIAGAEAPVGGHMGTLAIACQVP